jgi:UDP-N-acetylglucosamine:LPS N-acetylglucosamine transferase
MNTELFIRDWADRKVFGKKSFNDVFQIDGQPLWWFYERFFTKGVMPKQINTLYLINQEKPISFFNRLRFSFNSKILRYYLKINEKNKIKHSTLKDTTNDPKALFLSYTNHILPGKKVFRIQKIVDQIKTDKKLNPFVMFVEPLSARHDKKAEGSHTVYDYYNKKLADKANKIATDMVKKWQKIPSQKRKEFFKNKKYDLWKFMKYPMNFFMSKDFLFYLILNYELAKRILVRENIKTLVLTARNGLFEKCLIAGSKSLGVPVILVQHGILDTGTTQRNVVGNMKIAAFGDMSSKNFQKIGISKENIVITGPVVFYNIEKYINKKKLKSKYKNILIITQPIIEVNIMNKKKYFKYFEQIIKKIRHIEKVKFIIKLHPRDTHFDDYLHLAKQYGDIKVVQKGKLDLLYKLIYECDLMINFFGTATILEASILDRPVITIQLPNAHQEYWDKFDPSLKIKYPNKIKESVELILNKPNTLKTERSNLVKKFCYKVDGKAHIRVANLIYELSKI